ncbi:EAL domain-containing protein [Sulfurimonas aquatica]|uniref:EAL domain-containing protein n=1 Tax=Sulfurimonas aquatica TaxID=2672570 RepID=A0A975GCA6_9BACT|nr:EAL domain-containing protein [Sulfurimonas aquatica]QSZ41093.1 EAL domain-containing protein [Sulfurimonas aquatica]
MIRFNNIWKVFWILSLGAVFLFILLLYLNYKNIENKYHLEIEHYADIISKSVQANFLQKETVLSVLGDKLMANDTYKNEKLSAKILNTLIQENPSIVDFNLADTKGNILLKTSSINLKNRFNILKNELTSVNFQEALKSKQMIVSRGYLSSELKQWVIPLRKAIRDSSGKTLAVATAIVLNSKNGGYFDYLRLSSAKALLIVKDYDSQHKIYVSYHSETSDNSSQSIYANPLPAEMLANIKNKLIRKNSKKFNTIEETEEVISIEHADAFGIDKIAGITYNKRYHLWISLEIEKENVWNEFTNIFFINLAIFIIGYSILIFLFRNINTSEERKNRELTHQAQHDILTSLPNRTYMYAEIEEWKKKHPHKYYVMYLDLDNFKNINDKFGHTIGDEILVEVSQRLKSFFTSEDMLVRQGGDEFIVFKEGIDEKELEQQVAELIVLISKIYHIDNKEFRIGMSVGIAQYPVDARSVEELLSLSDTAMYEAKKRKNSYCLFSEKMRYTNMINADIESELRGAIENDELWMVYQPQINSDETLYGVEALIRWENKKLGFVGPDKFIIIAEETGLIRELGNFIMLHSLREIKSIQEELGVYFELSINISVIQLMEDDFLSNLLKYIEQTGFEKGLLTLEITESLSIKNLDYVLPLLSEIRDSGIQISLDDFGTGYSSLSILRDLPITELKIDKSFVDKILYDESEKILVESIINIGKNFNMKIVAEGVESQDQIKVLKNANCDIFQGYYYSKPLTKHNLIEYLTKIGG